VGEAIQRAGTDKARANAKRRKVEHRRLCDFERQTWRDRCLLAESEPARCEPGLAFLTSLTSEPR
jgi:hypothetical protein